MNEGCMLSKLVTQAMFASVVEFYFPNEVHYTPTSLINLSGLLRQTLRKKLKRIWSGKVLLSMKSLNTYRVYNVFENRNEYALTSFTEEHDSTLTQLNDGTLLITTEEAFAFYHDGHLVQKETNTHINKNFSPLALGNNRLLFNSRIGIDIIVEYNQREAKFTKIEHLSGCDYYRMLLLEHSRQIALLSEKSLDIYDYNYTLVKKIYVPTFTFAIAEYAPGTLLIAGEHVVYTVDIDEKSIEPICRSGNEIAFVTAIDKRIFIVHFNSIGVIENGKERVLIDTTRFDVVTHVEPNLIGYFVSKDCTLYTLDVATEKISKYQLPTYSDHDSQKIVSEKFIGFVYD